MSIKMISQNKKAFFDYFIEDSYEAGVVLTGAEVKSIKLGHVNLKDSYCSFDRGEMYLKNCFIAVYEKDSFGGEERRPRKLLMHCEEIKKLLGKTKVKGLTLIPTKIYFKDNRVKVEIALAKGKHTYDKRDTIKEKDIERDAQRQIKRY